jgi:hypothetical protein
LGFIYLEKKEVRSTYDSNECGDEASDSTQQPRENVLHRIASSSASSGRHEHKFRNDRNYQSQCVKRQLPRTLIVTNARDAGDDLKPGENRDSNDPNDGPCPNRYERDTL